MRVFLGGVFKDLEISQKEPLESDAPGSTILEARTKDGTYVGHIKVEREPFTKKPYSSDVYVDPQFRRQGVATKLYQAAESHTGEAMHPNMYQSEDGQGFWRSEGGKSFGTKNVQKYMDMMSEARSHLDRNPKKYTDLFHKAQDFRASDPGVNYPNK